MQCGHLDLWMWGRGLGGFGGHWPSKDELFKSDPSGELLCKTSDRNPGIALSLDEEYKRMEESEKKKISVSLEPDTEGNLEDPSEPSMEMKNQKKKTKEDPEVGIKELKKKLEEKGKEAKEVYD